MRDPVCGMEVSEPPKIKAERGGVVYGFCSESCRKRFEAGEGPKAMDPAAPSLSGYLILAGVFAGILAFTYWRRAQTGDFSAAETMSDFMGAFFLVFGAFKLLDLNSFADAYSTYDLVAAKSRAYALAYPFIQLALGGAYLTRFNPGLVNIAALLIMSVSSAGVVRALFSGRKIRCACLGTKIRLPMSTISLVEDVLMAVMAAAMLAPHI